MHSHTERGPRPEERARTARSLRLALCLTGAFTIAEAAGGLLTGSLALLADAGHMLSDDLSLAIALLAISFARRPPTPQRSFGYQRAEVLAALANGVLLIVISAWILWEAIGRLSDPPDVLGGPMLAVAVGGIAVNLAAFRILSGGPGHGRDHGLNVTAAMRHVLADLAGSVGAVVASILVIAFGWELADPLVGGLIGLLVMASGIPIVRDATRVLLEQAPAGIEVTEIGEAMATAPGVAEVHDLHVWTITSGFSALSAHVLVGTDDDCHLRRLELEELLRDRFGIEHTTLQMEHRERPELLQVEGADEVRGTA
jgi:cobalt-zinc-cadmium efflux system protein